MPNMIFRTLVPGTPERVYEYVTAYPASGRVSQRALEEKHGKLIEQDGDDYVFREDAEDAEDAEGGIIWRCTFDPPLRRVMRAQGFQWADRIDYFEPSGDGTLWTVRWEPKATGFRSYTQWLMFHIRGKSQVQASLIMPVVQHFQQAPTSPARPTRRRPRRRR